MCNFLFVIFLLQKYLKKHLSLIYVADIMECSLFCISLEICELQIAKMKKVYIGVSGLYISLYEEDVYRKF